MKKQTIRSRPSPARPKPVTVRRQTASLPEDCWISQRQLVGWLRDLLELSRSDPALAAEIERLMREGAPLADVLALRGNHPRQH